MNLFEQPPATNLFEGMVPPESQAATPEDARRTARLAALANLPQEAQGYFEHMDEMTRIYEDRITQEGDAGIRREIAARDQQERLGALGEVLRGSIPGMTEEDRQGAALAFQSIQQADLQEQEDYLLEQRAVQRIQDLAQAGDVTQARLYLSNLENGDALDVQRDYEARRLIMMREIDRAQIAVEDQPWFRHVADFFSSWIPLDTSTGNVGNVDIAEGMDHWYDNLLSGQRVRREAETLWDMPLAEFSRYVREELIPNITDNSRNLLGYESATQRLNILSQLGERTPEAWEINAWDAVDAIGLVPFTSLARGFRAVPFMVRNGARREAVDTVVDAVLRAERSTVDDAVRATGMTADELTDAISPRALSVEPDDLGVGIAADANDAIVQGRELVQRLTRQADLTGQPRMTGDEFQAMVAKTEETLRAEFGNRVVKDVDIRPINLAGGSSVNQVSFTLGRARGGFATKKAVQEYLTSIGYAGDIVREAGPAPRRTAPIAAPAPRAPDRPIQEWAREQFYDADGNLTVTRKEAADGINAEMRRRALASVTGGEEIAPVVSTTQDASGQWFARVTRTLPEAGFYTQLMEPKNTFLGRVLSARSVSDEFTANLAQDAGNKRNKLLRTLVNPYRRTFRQLPHDERQTLDQILAKGENEGVWFSEGQLDEIYERLLNRRPTAREIEAYQSARQINDIEYAIRNDEEFKRRALAGMENVEFKIGEFEFNSNALVKELDESPPRQRFYDTTTGTHHNRADQVTLEQWNRYRAGGYRLVLAEQAVELPDGTTLKTFIMHPSDMRRGSLNPQQINYRAGGHRMYDAPYFVKQAVYGVQGDTGERFLKNPNTYIAARTRGEANFWAKRMEAARLAYLRGDGATVIDEILGGHAGLPSADEFIDLMKRRKFQEDEPFEVLGDRELPSIYNRTPDGMEWVDLDETGFNGFLRTQGRMYTSQKGDHLPDFAGRMAPTLDSYETLNRSLMNIASITSFSDYKISSVSRWVNTFKHVIDDASYDDTASDMFKFLNGRLKTDRLSDADFKIVQEAERQREIVRRVIGWKTPWDVRADRMNRQFADFIAGNRVDGYLPNKRAELSNWWLDQNPVGALRGIAFDLTLGLLNIAQFPLQLSSAIAATALSPKRGMQGWALAIPSRVVLTRKTVEDLENLLTEMVNRNTHDLGGFDNVDEFKNYMRTIWRSGFFDIGGTHGLLDHYGPSGAVNGFLAGQDRVREFGRFFFNEGERGNRLVAWRIAWDEARTRYPEARWDDREFLRYLQGRAEDYSFGMSRESQAWWQKGVLSIPTQFFAYNARMIETLIGTNGFTWQQRVRLAAVMVGLYGVSGVPLVGAAADAWKQQQGDAPDIGTFWSYADRGFIDNWVHSLTGVDVKIGERFGTGGWLTDTVAEIFGHSQYGEVSVADVVGGASASILGTAIGSVIEAALIWSGLEGGDETNPLRRDSLERMARQVASVNNALKAYMVYRYGQYQTGTGSTMVDDLPPATAFAVALSFVPGELDDVSAMRAYRENRSEAIADAARIIRNYRVDMLNRPDQAATLGEEVNAFVRLLPDDIRRQALAEADGTVSRSYYQGLTEYYERNPPSGATD